MLKRPSVIVVALGFTLALSFAAEPETRTFKVLVAPGEGVSSSAFSRVADLAATLEKQPYTIRSAEPVRPGEGRTVIVVDFAATSAANDACLLAEVLSAMNKLHENPPPLLVDRGETRLIILSGDGPFEHLDIYSGGDLPALLSECESGRRADSWKSSFKKDYYSRIDPDSYLSYNRVFAEVRTSFGAQEAPVRVFWLAETFKLFDFWKSGNCMIYLGVWLGCQGGTPHKFEDLGSVAEADVTFFPVVFGKWDRGRLESPSRSQVKQAEVLAESTGGFVSIVSGQPGDTLVRAFERTRQGVVLTLEGPVTTDGLHPAKAQTLTIKAGGVNPAVTWQRPFAVSPAGSVKQKTGYLAPIVFPNQLGLSYDCQASDASAGERSLALKLPPEAVALPSGLVDVYLDYPNEKGLHKQRFTFTRTQGVAGSLCLPMIHASDGMKFQVVVVDRASEQVWAAAGVLSDSEDDQ